jgi:RTX calcium-binding nonapeptide repeat (4 copies)
MAKNWMTLYGHPLGGDLSYFQSVMTGKTFLKGAGNDKFNGTRGDDLIRAGSGNDTVGANQGNDWVDAGRGNNYVKAGGGADFVQGNEGNDQVWGESGDDWIDGGGGKDRLFGGTGDDWVFAWTGNDHVEGGEGNDLLDGGPGSDNVYGGNGDDELYAGSSGTDHLYGGSGSNTLYGWEYEPSMAGRYSDHPSDSIHYHLEGKLDVVWDNGISDDTDYLHYTGKGAAQVHWFGGAAHTVYDPENYGLSPYHSFGKTDKVVMENVVVNGNKIDNFVEFQDMIASGQIGYASTSIASRQVEDYYYPLDGSSTVGNWDVGNIFLDFGPAADGTPRYLNFEQTSLSGTEGFHDFKEADWLFV